MHSNIFTAIARQADEVNAVVVGMIEDPRAPRGAVVLFNEDTGTYEFAKFTLVDDEVIFSDIVSCHGNQSKAYKYLSDYTLDLRGFVPLESGALIENPAKV